MLPLIISAIESPEDRELMTEFYLKYNKLLCNEARKFLNTQEDVEDAVYEALTKVINKMDVFRTLQPLQQVQYALTTVRNLAIVSIRRSNLYTMVSYEDMDYEIPASQETSPDALLENEEFTSFVREIWKELDLDDRTLLEQKYVLKWSDVELAALFGIKPQSVRMRLTRAKRNLLNELKKKNISLYDWL